MLPVWRLRCRRWGSGDRPLGPSYYSIRRALQPLWPRHASAVVNVADAPPPLLKFFPVLWSQAVRPRVSVAQSMAAVHNSYRRPPVSNHGSCSGGCLCGHPAGGTTAGDPPKI